MGTEGLDEKRPIVGGEKAQTVKQFRGGKTERQIDAGVR